MKRKLLLIAGLLVAFAATIYLFFPRKPAAPLVAIPPRIDIRQLQEEWIPVQRAILTGKADEALVTIESHPEWLNESRFRNLVIWSALRKMSCRLSNSVLHMKWTPFFGPRGGFS